MCAPCFQAEGLNPAAIAAFKYTFEKLVSGANLMIPESAVKPTESLPDYGSLTKEDPQLLKSTVMVKLNGGLGTGMGLEKAKSLLPLKDGLTFLDFIAKQVGQMRSAYGVPLAFMLMNSFATSADTLEYLSKYGDLQSEGLPLEFVQNKGERPHAATESPVPCPSFDSSVHPLPLTHSSPHNRAASHGHTASAPLTLSPCRLPLAFSTQRQR